jgi:Domain of unknown function (DUF1918)
MYARSGDRLVVEGDPGRTALIIEVPHEDGSPPYIVKWLADGHIAMVSPGEFARIVTGGKDMDRAADYPCGAIDMVPEPS